MKPKKQTILIKFFIGISSNYSYNNPGTFSLQYTMTEEIHHTPVMLQEVLNSLPANPKIIVDGTLGHGGHTSNMLRLFPTIQKLYGFDLDPNIFRETKEKLEPEFGDRILFQNKSYTEMKSVLGDEKVDFVLVDLGVNMEHFKDGNRGFSTNIDGKLDMRFDNTNGKSAYDIVNTYSMSELANIFELYAEFAPKKSEEIAKKIVEVRKNKKIETTFELKYLLNELGLGQNACAIILIISHSFIDELILQSLSLFDNVNL